MGCLLGTAIVKCGNRKRIIITISSSDLNNNSKDAVDATKEILLFIRGTVHYNFYHIKTELGQI